jgi:hypothetical protein
MSIKKGDVLRQKVQVVQGPVKKVAYDDETGEFKYLIVFTEADGDETERWFDAKDVELVPAEEPPAAGAGAEVVEGEQQ